MTLSVIIPCRNAAGTIQETLRALAGQTWPGEWEVIVADNGSTDDLAQVVDVECRTRSARDAEGDDWLPRFPEYGLARPAIAGTPDDPARVIDRLVGRPVAGEAPAESVGEEAVAVQRTGGRKLEVIDLVALLHLHNSHCSLFVLNASLTSGQPCGDGT